jgi:hypothetical protein
MSLTSTSFVVLAGVRSARAAGRLSTHISTVASYQAPVLVKAGTIFEGPPLGLDKRLPAIWATPTSSGISSRGLARAFATQKPAWFMLH